MSKRPKILIVSASGIGCTILFTPTLKAIREKFPDGHITFLGIAKSFVVPVQDSPYVDEVMVFDFPKNSLMQVNKIVERLGAILKIRKKRFDYCFTVFPSNKWFFNVFAWLSGARKRITHSYQTPSWQNLQFLQNLKVQAKEGLHDVEQNINLLSALGEIPETLDRTLHVHISPEITNQADNYSRTNFVEQKKIVGMHVGSSSDFAFELKRWPLEKFTELIDRLQLELDVQVVLFAGPSEANEVNRVQLNLKTNPLVINMRLEMVAALIQRCDLMVSSDSGLMHIAAAVGTPIVAIFGPTNVSRTRPYTSDATIIFDPQKHSLLKYPFATTKANMIPREALRCFETITVEKVFTAVQEKLHLIDLKK